MEWQNQEVSFFLTLLAHWKNKYTLFTQQSDYLVMNRGYDSNKVYEYIQNQGHQFIIRFNDCRYLINKNKRIKVPQLANHRKGKHCDLKVSHIQGKSL